MQFLHDELSSMRAALEDSGDIKDPDKETNAWRMQVMELVYDTKDCIDDFRCRVKGPYDGQELERKFGHVFETLMAMACYQISKKITEIKTRVEDIRNRRTRFGGLGKTTLANEVYCNLSESFICKAIISVSQRPEMMSFLKSMFSKISGKGVDDHINDMNDLLNKLQKYLQVKRCKVVLELREHGATARPSKRSNTKRRN